MSAPVATTAPVDAATALLVIAASDPNHLLQPHHDCIVARVATNSALVDVSLWMQAARDGFTPDHSRRPGFAQIVALIQADAAACGSRVAIQHVNGRIIVSSAR